MPGNAGEAFHVQDLLGGDTPTRPPIGNDTRVLDTHCGGGFGKPAQGFDHSFNGGLRLAHSANYHAT